MNFNINFDRNNFFYLTLFLVVDREVETGRRERSAGEEREGNDGAGEITPTCRRVQRLWRAGYDAPVRPRCAHGTEASRRCDGTDLVDQQGKLLVLSFL